MKRYLIVLIAMAMGLCSGASVTAQYDITEFVDGEPGPWSDVDKTTLVVPMVPDGSIVIDGAPSSDEYGGFTGVEVMPGSGTGEIGNAWILGFAQNKNWEGNDDSSFTFWLAHDTDYLYVGIDAKDDEVVSDNENIAFWQDDSIEIVIDALNSRTKDSTDHTVQNSYGGHSYVNYEGRLSEWDEDAQQKNADRPRWSAEVDWTWGAPDTNADHTAFGEETEGGWHMETRFAKRLFEDPNVGNKLTEGYKMGFNIGMDDDDGSDLEIQYWWANRAHPREFDLLAFEDGETIADYPPDEFEWLHGGQPLGYGASGEIIFGGLAATLPGDCNADGAVNADDLACVDTVESRDVVLGAVNSLPGDLDGEGGVAFADFLVLSANFGNDTASYAEGNIDLDGGVAFADFLILSANFGKTPAAAASVPEPSGIALLGMAGLLGLVTRKRIVG